MRGNKKKMCANFFESDFGPGVVTITNISYKNQHIITLLLLLLTLKSNGAKKELRTKQSHKANITKERQKMKRLLGIWAH